MYHDHVQSIQPQYPDWRDVSVASRQGRIRGLADLALYLRQRETPGVALWRELTRTAASAYATTELTPVQQADFAMQDLAVVILGPNALKYLRWFDKITPDQIQDPLVNQFFAELGRLGLPPAEPVLAWRETGYMSKLDDEVDPGLDRHFGADFRPEINDHTDNQIFHTFFYQFMAYITRASLTIRAASVYHELVDKGGSEADHTAALIGIRAGTELRRLRDSGTPALEDWPELILAAYGKQPLPENAGPRAHHLRQQIDTLIAHPGSLDTALRGIEYSLIRLVKGKP